MANRDRNSEIHILYIRDPEILTCILAQRNSPVCFYCAPDSARPKTDPGFPHVTTGVKKYLEEERNEKWKRERINRWSEWPL